MLQAELRLFRAKNGLSQGDLAKQLGVAQNSVSQWESGKRFPTVRRLSMIAKTLGCPVESLLPVGIGGAGQALARESRGEVGRNGELATDARCEGSPGCD